MPAPCLFIVIYLPQVELHPQLHPQELLLLELHPQELHPQELLLLELHPQELLLEELLFV